MWCRISLVRDPAYAYEVLEDKKRHIEVYIPLVNFKQVFEQLFGDKSEPVDVDALRESLLKAAQEEGQIEANGDDNIGQLFSSKDNYILFSQQIEGADGLGPVEYAEAIDFNGKFTGDYEAGIVHSENKGTVSFIYMDGQRKTTLRMSEERFLYMMGYRVFPSYENSEIDFIEGPLYYKPISVGLGADFYTDFYTEPQSRSQTIAEAIGEASLKFAIGVGQGARNFVRDSIELLDMYADAVAFARNDPEAFLEATEIFVRSTREALENEKVRQMIYKSMAKEVTTPDGLGRITGEILTGGVVGRFLKLGKIKKVAKAVESNAIRLGTLKKIGENTWESAAGLVYKGVDYNGLNRIEHVLLHTQPNPAKKLHTVFNVERNEVFKLIDEAWLKRGAPLVDRGRDVYLIPMNKKIGVNGEKAIKIVTESKSREIISAYPVKL